MDTLTLLDTIPGARDAVKYLTARVADFQRLPSKMDAVERQVVQMKAIFDSRNNYLASGKAALIIRDIAKLRADYNQSAAGVADVLDGARNAGLLGGVDLNLLILSIKTAATVAGALAAYTEVEKVTNQLAQAELKPGEMQQVTGKGGPGLLMLVLVGGSLFALFRRRGGRRSLW
jgi:hypothetical protein